MIINYKNLPLREALYEYFYILNTAQPNKKKRLATSEITAFTEFLLLPDKFKDKRFGSLAKTKVLESLEELGIPIQRANLNNKIYALLGKEYLRKDTDSVMYPKEYILKGLEGIRNAENNNGTFDITFKFSYDNKGLKGAVQTNSPTDGSTTLQSGARDQGGRV